MHSVTSSVCMRDRKREKEERRKIRGWKWSSRTRSSPSNTSLWPDVCVCVCACVCVCVCVFARIVCIEGAKFCFCKNNKRIIIIIQNEMRIHVNCIRVCSALSSLSLSRCMCHIIIHSVPSSYIVSHHHASSLSLSQWSSHPLHLSFLSPQSLTSHPPSTHSAENTLYREQILYTSIENISFILHPLPSIYCLCSLPEQKHLHTHTHTGFSSATMMLFRYMV